MEEDDTGPGGVKVCVLGPTVLTSAAGEPIPITQAEGRILARLVLDAAGASARQLEWSIWRTHPPHHARQSLHNHVHRLRGKLAPWQLRYHAERYAVLPALDTDAAEFECRVTAGLDAHYSGDSVPAIDILRSALALWNGEPFADLPPERKVTATRRRLVRLRDQAREGYVAALVAVGRLDLAVTELTALLDTDPGHESRWELLLETLLRMGRRADALDAYRRARDHLVSEHGVEPGERLQHLHRLLLHGATRAPSHSDGLVPVGRTAPVALTLKLLGQGERVVITGEAGIGKSVVLQQVVDRWEGSALVVRCGEHLGSALGPVRALLDLLGPDETTGAEPSALADNDAARQSDRFGPLSSPGSLLRRAADLVCTGLARVGSPLLVLDDLDRCGPTTRAVLGDGIGASHVPVVAASRAPRTALPAWIGPEVPLTGLDQDATVALAEQVLRAEIDPAFATWLQVLTAGQPLFVVACLRDLIDRAILTVGARPSVPASTPLPADVVATLRRRIDGLGVQARSALDVMAVLGRAAVPLALVDALCDLKDLQPAVADGILVVRDDGVSFAHALFQAAAYDAVPQGRRIELHRAAGALSLPLSQRADHLLAAVDLDPAAAREVACAAAAEALTANAYTEAASWYDRALGVHDGLDDMTRLRLRLERSNARRLAGTPGHDEELLAVAQEALDAGAVDLGRQAVYASLQLGGAVEAGPSQVRAAALADRVLQGESDRGWWCRIAAAASLVHSIAGSPERCRELFLDAWTRAPDDDAVLAEVLPFAYMALAHPDDLELRERVGSQLAAVAQRTGSPAAAWEAGHLRFSVALQRGDGATARQVHREMEALGDLVGDAGRRWSMHYQAAALAALDGRLDDAEALALAALEIGTGVAPRRAFAAYAGQIFEVRRLQGRLAELTDLVLRTLTEQPEIPGWASVAALCCASSEPDRSRTLFDGVIDDLAAAPRDFSWLASMTTLGRTAIILDDPARAVRASAILRPYTDRAVWQGTCTWGTVAEVLAGLAEVQGDAEDAGRFRAIACRMDQSMMGRPRR